MCFNISSLRKGSIIISLFSVTSVHFFNNTFIVQRQWIFLRTNRNLQPQWVGPTDSCWDPKWNQQRLNSSLLFSSLLFSSLLFSSLLCSALCLHCPGKRALKRHLNHFPLPYCSVLRKVTFCSAVSVLLQ